MSKVDGQDKPPKATREALEAEIKKLGNEIKRMKSAKSVDAAASELFAFVQKTEVDPIMDNSSPWKRQSAPCIIL